MSVEWADIVDSVQVDQVLEALGISVSHIVRGEHWASCQLPTHPSSDSKPSFSINEDTLLWHCFTCNEGGLLPRLVAQMLDLDGDEDGSSWEKAIEWLLPFSDVDVHSDAGFQEQLERYLERTRPDKRRERIGSTRLPFFNPRVFDNLDYCPVELLEKWHIYDEETVETFGIRYDPERVRIKGQKEYIGEAIVIPHIFRGKLVGYQERWLDPERPRWIPKYTNSDDFPKRQTLFGWDVVQGAIRQSEPVTVVESSLTTARLYEIGFPAVATFGAGVNEEQIVLLQACPGGIILARDEDPDYINTRGDLVKGAGVQNFWANADRLTHKTKVWTLPPIPQEKGDLADLDTQEVLSLYSRKKTVFRLQAPPKKRIKR